MQGGQIGAREKFAVECRRPSACLGCGRWVGHPLATMCTARLRTVSRMLYHAWSYTIGSRFGRSANQVIRYCSELIDCTVQYSTASHCACCIAGRYSSHASTFRYVARQLSCVAAAAAAASVVDLAVARTSVAGHTAIPANISTAEIHDSCSVAP